MNQEIVGRDRSKIADQNLTPGLFDSPLERVNAVSSYEVLPNPPRHGNTNNMAFADGHTQGIRPEMKQWLK